MALPCQSGQSGCDGRAVESQICELQLLSADFCFNPVVPGKLSLGLSQAKHAGISLRMMSA